MKVSFEIKIWDDFNDWADISEELYYKITSYIKNKMYGIDDEKSEPMIGALSDCYRWRIDSNNDLIYRINGDVMEIISCKGHYNDK